MRVTVDEGFRPAPWFANPHLQSMLPTLPWRRRLLASFVHGVCAASRELTIDCGEGTRLQAFAAAAPVAGGAAPPPVAGLLHGWEGSADSLYVLSLAQQLFARGFEVLRLNLRDHGATHHLNRGLFHSCRLAEVVGALASIQRGGVVAGRKQQDAEAFLDGT